MMIRRTAVNSLKLMLASTLCVTSLLTSSSCNTNPSSSHDSARSALNRVCTFLWSQQGDDGAWRSQTYAYFRRGEALTPFVLWILLEARALGVTTPDGRVERALEFLRDNLDQQNRLGYSDPDLAEYPNYATAFALRCFVLGSDPRDRNRIAQIREYLLAQQYRAPVATTPASSSLDPMRQRCQGGWGMGIPTAPGHPGHIDLSYTRHVLEALAESGGIPVETQSRAEEFLEGLQHRDGTHRGGFFFSPSVPDANKAGLAGDVGLPYATPTCDGYLSTVALNVSSDDPRRALARAWLETHFEWRFPAGIPPTDPNGWRDAIHYYHLAVRAEAHSKFTVGKPWREPLWEVLLESQRDNGSFVNDRNHLMKENDPILCSALGAIALLKSLTTHD